MGRQWPAGGPWIIVPACADVNLSAAVAALAASASARVAGVVIGGDLTPDDWAGTWASLRDQPSRAEAITLISTFSATHGLVLIVGVPSLLAQAGREGWTITDLAAQLGAPVVVVTGETTDAADHTAKALGLLDRRGLAGAVIVVSDADSAPEALAALPVRPAGRVPSTSTVSPEAARGLLDPMLHASADPTPEPSVLSLSLRSASSGTRLVLLLVLVFIVMSLAAVGLALHHRPTLDDEPGTNGSSFSFVRE
ncbi:AAA family ATPase [Catenuloplanes sp. NPDC051500]|uniref:AAA family ATPase n=1 Tax=Catenuloplanes sp. NPDC051500 TaxID=3363959 RepID=UPI003796250C